jgi:cell division protein FtsB
MRTTTRATNLGWYQEALDQNLQIHLRMDGATIISFYHDHAKSRWSNGPALTEEALYDSVKLASFVSETLRYAKTNGATSLGVILHIADEFATTELKAELDNPGALAELRTIAVSDPGSILQDTSISADQAAWRVMPYPAGGSTAIGTAVTVSQHYAPLFKLLRETGENENFPIITHALSAPLVALLGLSETIQPSPNKSFVTILQYPWFTTLAFFNEHSDLRLIRTLQHRGLRRPTNFRNSLATSNAALEFVDPDLFLVPLGSNVDATLAADLQASFSACRVEVVEQIPRERMPAWCPEPMIAVQSPLEATIKTSLTFQILREEKWALQNFLPTPPEIAEMFPARSEIKLLHWVRLTRVAVILPTLLTIGYFGYTAFEMSQRPESKFDTTQVAQTKARLESLKKEITKIEHWNNLLEDRSKAWACMELFARMFPEKGGTLVKAFSYSAKPDTLTAAASSKNTKVGFSREWKVTGLSQNFAKQTLNKLSTQEGIATQFNEIFRITGNSAYNPVTASRRLLPPIMPTTENSSYKLSQIGSSSLTDESSYPQSFALTITQQFDATDPLAIDMAKAP